MGQNYSKEQIKRMIKTIGKFLFCITSSNSGIKIGFLDNDSGKNILSLH